MNWLLCDFGEVLSLPQAPGEVQALASLAGMSLDRFRRAYDRPRLAYDRGDLSASEYWAEVLGKAPGDLLPVLVETDVKGWIRPNQVSIEGARQAAKGGLRLALLSNMPAEIAVVVDNLSWLSDFQPRMFSCDLRLAKPDPAIYRVALERLGATPDEVTFVDDRQANIAAARDIGMRVVLFDDPARFPVAGDTRR